MTHTGLYVLSNVLNNRLEIEQVGRDLILCRNQFPMLSSVEGVIHMIPHLIQGQVSGVGSGILSKLR